jgi:predicted HTH domain antitoxin
MMAYAGGCIPIWYGDKIKYLIFLMKNHLVNALERNSRLVPCGCGFLITFRSRCACYTCNYAYSAIPRDKENSFEIIKELNGKLSHHHDNGNVSNRTSMGIDLFNRIGAIRIFERYAEIFPLTKQRVNFLQKELARRNICTNFGESKRDVQRVKITHTLSQSSIELRAIHWDYYSGVNCTSRSI